MRILFDAHLFGHRATGDETYTIHLVHSLASLPELTCAIAMRPRCALPSLLAQAQLEVLRLQTGNNWARLLYDLPRLCRGWKTDLLHVNYVAPFLPPCPLVVTVHDVSFKRFPEFFPPRDRLLFATLLPLTLHHAAAVITVSEFSRGEILAEYPFLDGKVHLTREAPAPRFRPVTDTAQLDAIRARYGLNSTVVLALGNVQPRKNLLRLIKAFAAAHHQIKSAQLVIVGKAGWQAATVYAAVDNLGLAEHVVFTGYVSDDDLVLLLNAASVMVYPSLYEGFGLPVLEAMACGTPVITSNTTSLPEVAGGAALLVDPLQESAIAEAILKVLGEPDLAAALSRKGLERAQSFSWHTTAEQTSEVYRSVLTDK